MPAGECECYAQLRATYGLRITKSTRARYNDRKSFVAITILLKPAAVVKMRSAVIVRKNSEARVNGRVVARNGSVVVATCLHAAVNSAVNIRGHTQATRYVDDVVVVSTTRRWRRQYTDGSALFARLRTLRASRRRPPRHPVTHVCPPHDTVMWQVTRCSGGMCTHARGSRRTV